MNNSARKHIYLEAPRGINRDEFVAKYYQPGMTSEEAKLLIATHPDIAQLKLRDRVRAHLFINVLYPLGLDTISDDEFFAKNYRLGMTLEEAENLLATHPVITIMFNIRFRPDVIYTMHTPMRVPRLYLTLSSYYIDGMSEYELASLSFADQTVQWNPSLHNTFSNACNSIVIAFLLCMQSNVFTEVLPYLPVEILFEILSNFRRQDFISN